MANHPQFSREKVGKTRFEQLRSLFEQGVEKTTTTENFTKIKDVKSKIQPFKSASSQRDTVKNSENIDYPSTQEVRQIVHNVRPQTSIESGRSVPIQSEIYQAMEDKLSQKSTKDDYHSKPGIRQYYELIVNKTVLDKTVCDHLLSSCTLIVEDRETIMKKDTQQHRNRTLMDILLNRPYAIDTPFKEALANDSCNKWLGDMLHNPGTPEEQESYVPVSIFLADISDHTVKIQKNYHSIVHGADLKGLVVDQLHAENVLSREDYDEVWVPGLTTAESNRRLITKIIYRERAAYDAFIASLRQDKCYINLADIIEQTNVTDRDKELIQIAKSKLEDQLEDKILKVEHYEIKRWRGKLKHFVKTSITKQIQHNLQNHQFVILTGSSGSGKTANAFFVALEMEVCEGYVLHLANDPTDIQITSDDKQIFIFDDACGKVCVDAHAVNMWRKYENSINDLLKSSKHVKLLVISRTIIDVKNVFNGITATVVKECVITTTLQERKWICESYLPQEVTSSISDETMELYSFFPLLCTMYFENERGNADLFFRSPYDVVQDELAQIMENDKPVFLCLALLVVLNNKVTKDKLRFGNHSLDELLKCLCEEGPLDVFPSTKLVLSGFQKLTDTYIAQSATTFSALHDRMFDIMSKYLGLKFINTILIHGDSSLISERLVFKSLQNEVPKFATQIPQDLEIEYFNRLKLDISNKKYWEVFGNIQTQHKEYRKTFIAYMQKENIRFDNDKDDEFSPLLVVSFLGHLDFVEYIISKNHSLLNKCDDFGRSPLYIAVRNDFPEIVQLLLKNGADVNIRNRHGWSPLHKACQTERPETVQLLINHGANVNAVGERKRSAVHLACEKGNLELVKCLYENQAHIEQVDENGWTPLHIACQQGNIAVVSLLLEAGSHINLAEERNWTPLHIASGNGHTDVCKTLLDWRVEVDMVEEKGGTPLYLACQNGNKDIVSLLIEHGASVNTFGNILLSPIRAAKLNNHKSVCRLLEQHGAIDKSKVLIAHNVITLKNISSLSRTSHSSPLSRTSHQRSYHDYDKKKIEFL